MANEVCVELHASRILKTPRGRQVVDARRSNVFYVSETIAAAIAETDSFKEQFGLLLGFLDAQEPLYGWMASTSPEDETRTLEYYRAGEVEGVYVVDVVRRGRPEFEVVHAECSQRHPSIYKYEEIFSYIQTKELPCPQYLKRQVADLLRDEYELVLVVRDTLCYDQAATTGGSDG